MLALYVLTD